MDRLARILSHAIFLHELVEVGAVQVHESLLPGRAVLT
jgi:hypothetical protein